MSQVDLEGMRALLSKATPGPWSFAMTGSEGGSLIPVAGRGRIGRIADRNFDEDKANGALIVAAVNALPALLDEVEQLRRDRWSRSKTPSAWLASPPSSPMTLPRRPIVVETPAPLRRVVETFGEPREDRDGLTVMLPRERLECGHVVRPKSDIYATTVAVRRRCRECREEAHRG